MVNRNGCIVISLDFELLWGVFDLVDYKEKINYFSNTRKIVPSILTEFERHGIHATWAVVGMLFNEDWEEWERNIPQDVPQYSKRVLSAYQFGRENNGKETESLFFAPELIHEIQKVKGQEIGTHTYSHYYCLEKGQNPKNFKADLQKAVELAKKIGVDLKSLVFPRNQLREEYLKICSELGIENVRSNPDSWYWRNIKSESIFTKLARSGDAYLPLGRKSYVLDELERREGLPLEQKSSRFLRPVEGNNLLRKMKLDRIKKELTFAAKNRQIYHLWWHPHNFGARPEESLKDLKEILYHFDLCQKKYGLQSFNMRELNELRIRPI